MNCLVDFTVYECLNKPELSIGLPTGTGSGSLISTTTQSDIKNVFATEAACSKQHLTTYIQTKAHSGSLMTKLASEDSLCMQKKKLTFVGSMIPAAIKSSYLPVAAL